MQPWQARITVDPAICHGQPVITGTRIPLSVILANLGDGMSVERLLQSYPSLTSEDVQAALRYAAGLAQDRFIPFERAAG